MGRYDLEYPKDAINTVKRKGDRGVYALKTIHALVNSSPLLHISFNVPDSSFPTTLPMLGQMGSFSHPSSDLGSPLDLYLHGYVSSRIMNLSRVASTPAASEPGLGAAESGSPGLPVCIAVSHVDGLVLALSPFSHSYNYRSAVLFGHAAPVDDDAEKLYAMQLLTDGVVPGRWAATRQPPTRAEMQSTAVLRVRIASGSAKVREAGVGDEKEDLDNEEVVAATWTGVLPMRQVVGEPMPGPYNKVETPEYIADFTREFNEESMQQSVRGPSK